MNTEQNFDNTGLLYNFASMKRIFHLLIKKAVFIQLMIVAMGIFIFRCVQDNGKKSSAAQVPVVIDSSFMYKTPLTEKTKEALKTLEDSSRIKGDLGDQLITFIQNGIVDLSEQFKFISLKWNGRTSKVIESRRAEIDDLAKIMVLFPKISIRIDAYVDNDGNPNKDEEITQARADYIKKELMAAGVEESRILAKGFGQKYPVGNNKDEFGRMINNRIEVYLTKF